LNRQRLAEPLDGETSTDKAKGSDA